MPCAECNENPIEFVEYYINNHKFCSKECQYAADKKEEARQIEFEQHRKQIEKEHKAMRINIDKKKESGEELTSMEQIFDWLYN